MKNHIYVNTLFLGILVQVIFSITLHSQGIILVNDTIDLTPEIPKTVDILANDVIPQGDSIRIYPGGLCVSITDHVGGSYTFVANPNGDSWGLTTGCVGHYTLVDLTLDTNATALLVFRIRDNSFDSLYLNNINACFYADGIHFFGPDHGRFEVPKFSGKNTIFLSTLWIGGLDQNSGLHLAGERYGQGYGIGQAHSKFDFWAGPVMDSSAYSIYQDTLWNYIWNLKRSEIEYHKTHWNDAGYQPIHDILTWPGNGNVSLGQAAQLAPYFDRNNDGIYNPLDGDYPLIKGDQSLFFIFNDDRNIHTETQGEKMKVEIHGMAYVFDLPNDSAFNNTVFLSYKLFNRSDKIYHNTYLGVFTDTDIGYPNDDYIGCDVDRSYYYGYNGTPVDGSGQPGSYGANPPAQSVTILGGPFIDPDGCDNPSFRGNTLKGPSFKGDCSIVGLDSATILMHYGPGNADSGNFIVRDEAINGINFGDSIPDNERLGMTGFVYFNNSGVPSYMTDPLYATDYYNYLRGLWVNGDSIHYAGTGPVCHFVYPELSDTCNWGTRGIEPSPKLWTETTAGDAPGDRRGLGSSGPFTFNPGQEQDLDIAYTFARDYDNSYPSGSVGKLRELTDIIRHSFTTNLLPDGNSFNGIDNRTSASVLQAELFPNPASTGLYILFDRVVKDPVNIRVFNANGTIVGTERISPVGKMITLDVSGLSSGLYLVSVESNGKLVTKKVSVIR